MDASGRLTLAVGTFVGWRTVRLLLRILKRNRKYDGLKGLVSFSANLIAASRALETSLPDAYIHDPLSAHLAGPAAVARLRVRLAAMAATRGAGDGAAAAAAAPSSDSCAVSSGRPIPRLIMRTLFIDSAVLWAAGGAAPSAMRVLLSSPPPAGTSGAAPPCVVMLGAGQDARPWRLPLPQGVVWVELDMPDVVEAKLRGLKGAGAQLDPAESGGVGGWWPRRSRRPRHALRVASWRCLAADLAVRGWSSVLEEAGIARGSRTVFVAEGLFYYLAPPAVEALLQEAAGFCGAGSVLVASIISADSLQRIRGGGDPHAANAAAGGVAGTAGREVESLVSRFVWGYTGTAEEYFASCGWRVLAAPTWCDAAAAFGLRPDVPTGSNRPSAAGTVQFMVAELGPRRQASDPPRDR